MEIDFKRVTLIGLGLMGGSFGKALLTAQPKLQIVTFDPNGAALTGMHACDTLQEAVKEADLIVLATPLSAYETVLTEIGPNLKNGALIMDLGSVKGGLEALCSRCLPPHKQLEWVGGHPMCGSEKSGIAHADGNMFRGASFFLTSATGGGVEAHCTPNSLKPKTAKSVEALLRCIGARPIWVTEAFHDQTVALTSHLPHLSAAALMHCTTKSPAAETFMAGGFRDATRVAAGSETIWKDILLWNKVAILTAIEDYNRQLQAVATLLETEDALGLEAYLKTARSLKLALNSLTIEN